ncbi:hypothetical protein OROHE_014454 [Orobanche hederae]
MVLSYRVSTFVELVAHFGCVGNFWSCLFAPIFPSFQLVVSRFLEHNTGTARRMMKDERY